MTHQQLIQQLHDTYTQETGLSVPLDMARIYDWEQWLAYGAKWQKDGWNADTLRRVIRYCKRDKNRTLGYFKFRWFIGMTPNFAEDLAEANAAMRRPRPRPTVTQSSWSAHTPEAYSERNTTPAAQAAANALFELGRELGNKQQLEERK